MRLKKKGGVGQSERHNNPFEDVRVALAVQCLAQHAILHSTAQHPCALQHNATTSIIHLPSIVLAALGGQHCCSFGEIWLGTAIKF